MREYSQTILIFLPFFTLKKVHGAYHLENFIPKQDSVSRINSEILNVVKDFLGLSATSIGMASNVNTFQLEVSVFACLILFIIIDFYHSLTNTTGHQFNFIWNKKIIDLSTEGINRLYTLRQTTSNFINLFLFLLISAAIIGFPATVIVVLLIFLFLQLLHNFKYVKNISFLEHIFTTPEPHSLYYFINPKYIEKKYSPIFIITTKSLDTLKKRFESRLTVFTIIGPAQTLTQIRINFQYLHPFISDACSTENWKNRFVFWFKPTDGRPKNLEKNYPTNKMINESAFNKNKASSKLIFCSISKAWINLLPVSFYFYTIAVINLPIILIFGLFVFLTTYGYTELIDQYRSSVYWGKSYFLFGLSILYF